MQVFLNTLSTSWPWYLVRASGLVAAVALLLLLMSGIGFITGRTFRILEPIKAWASHRVLGIVLAFSVIIHITSLLFDKFVQFKLGDILVPFQSAYKPVVLFGINLGSVYVTFGILAFYLIMIIVASSLTIVNKTPRIWKWIHFLPYIVGVFIFVHALYLGTDLAGGLPRIIWWIGGIVVLIAVGFRLWRANTV